MKLCVIPARGGSKRIPRKNIKPFCGKPMLAYSIEAARQSGCFDLIIVSTDDDEIAELAKMLGAEVPFIRPKALSDDFAGTVPVIAHAVDFFEQKGIVFRHVCCLYATAPFVQPEKIREGMQLVEQNGIDYAFSVTRYGYPIQRALRVTEAGRIDMFAPELADVRSQDLEEAWHDAGQFYWGSATAWLEERQIFSPASLPVELPHYRVQDIDTPDDWRRAELMYQVLTGSNFD